MKIKTISRKVATVPDNRGQNHSFQGFFPVLASATTPITPNVGLIDQDGRHSLFSTELPTGINLHEFVTMLSIICEILKGNSYSGPLPTVVNPNFNLTIFVGLLMDPSTAIIFEGCLHCPEVFAIFCNILLRASLQSYPLVVPMISIPSISGTPVIAPGAQDENRPTVRNSSVIGNTQGSATVGAARAALRNAEHQAQAQNRVENPTSERIREEALEAFEEMSSKLPLSEVFDVLWGMPTTR